MSDNIFTTQPEEIKKQSVSSTMEIVKESVYRIIATVEHGEKITTGDLIDKVIAETNVQTSVANGLVPMIVREWEQLGNGTVNIGRNGGIYPGGKKIRVDPRVRCEACNQVVRQKSE